MATDTSNPRLDANDVYLLALLAAKSRRTMIAEFGIIIQAEAERRQIDIPKEDVDEKTT